jgi:hypothetical protein
MPFFLFWMPSTLSQRHRSGIPTFLQFIEKYFENINGALVE